MSATERKTCRGCLAPLPDENVLDLGNQAIVDFRCEGRGRAPLQLAACENCNLLQLRHSVDADVLYRNHYYYRSSVNEQMRADLRDVVRSAERFAVLNNGDWVCDIGANDGELLSNYSDHINLVGFEPSEICDDAIRRLPKAAFVRDYFDGAKAHHVAQNHFFKVVTACAMFYDLEDPKAFLSGVHRAMDDAGVFIVQINSLLQMLRNVSFDNVSHEHLCYYSLTTLKRLMDETGFVVVDVEQNDVNGGSMRVYAKKQGSVTTGRVKAMLTDESIITPLSYERFAHKVQDVCQILRSNLEKLKADGKRVYAYGASTRGATILQAALTSEEASSLLEGAADRDERKFGLSMAGLDLLIVPEDEARAKADVFLLLPYHFYKSIMKREQEWLSKGGRFLIPLPTPRLEGEDSNEPLVQVEKSEFPVAGPCMGDE